jgi:hypothetical protein
MSIHHFSTDCLRVISLTDNYVLPSHKLRPELPNLTSFPWRNSSWWARTSLLSRLHDHTQLDIQHSVGLLWKSDQPDAVNSYNTQRAQGTAVLPAGFEPTIPPREPSQTLTLNRAAIGIGTRVKARNKIKEY